MTEKKSKKLSNTDVEYNEASLASNDPTKIDAQDLERLAKEAMKKFKSL